MSNQFESEIPVDPEWFNLILKAKELGLSPEEIRHFLENQQIMCKDLK